MNWVVSRFEFFLSSTNVLIFHSWNQWIDFLIWNVDGWCRFRRSDVLEIENLVLILRNQFRIHNGFWSRLYQAVRITVMESLFACWVLKTEKITKSMLVWWIGVQFHEKRRVHNRFRLRFEDQWSNGFHTVERFGTGLALKNEDLGYKANGSSNRLLSSDIWSLDVELLLNERTKKEELG